MKRILSLIFSAAVLAVFVTVSAVSSGTPQRFSDLPETHWAYPAIESLASRGIISGFPDGTYRPDSPVTQGQWEILLAKAADLPGEYSGDTQAAVREDAVVSLMRAHGYPFEDCEHWDEWIDQFEWVEEELNRIFTDADAISPYAGVFVLGAVWDEYISGFPGGTFRPQATLTRAQAASILNKAFPPPPPPPPDWSGELPDVPKDRYVYRTTADGARHIKIGISYRNYYDSTHKSIDDNPRIWDRGIAQMELDNVRAVEEKHNVFIEYVNLTWEGIRESIPISILAGKPDADVYYAEAPTAVPAVLKNFAVGLESLGIAPDRFPNSENVVIESVRIPGQDETYLFKPAELHQGIYMIGYNKDMIQEHNLEDPQKLWDEDRWTWDVFRDYCTKITDRERNIYGWSGYWTNFLQGLLFSNNAAFAAGPVQTLDSPETVEVLQFISDIYNVDRSARPWDSSSWYANNNLYARGLSGFWISTTWLNNEQGGGRGGNREMPLDFELGMVPFPVGPNGSKETNAAINVEGHYYFIPQFIKDPKQVYEVMYDFTNWFDYDLELRDDPSWIRNSLATEDNFRYYMEMQGRVGFDLIFNLGILADTDLILPQLYPAMNMMTVRQYVETYKTVYQAALDRYFKFEEKPMPEIAPIKDNVFRFTHHVDLTDPDLSESMGDVRYKFPIAHMVDEYSVLVFEYVSEVDRPPAIVFKAPINWWAQYQISRELLWGDLSHWDYVSDLDYWSMIEKDGLFYYTVKFPVSLIESMYPGVVVGPESAGTSDERGVVITNWSSGFTITDFKIENARWQCEVCRQQKEVK